jgi:hypothetical protein
MSAGASRGRLATATVGPNFAEPPSLPDHAVWAVSRLGFALVMGVCGGLLPSRARLPIVSALRQA